MFDGVGRRRDAHQGQFLNIGQHSLNGYERNCLFRNNGDGTFTDVAYVNAADRIEDGRGLSIFDYDQDGQPDLLLRNYRQPAQLLRNRGGAGHWIELKLVGTRSNRDAVGARVRLHTGSGLQTRQVSAGSGYVSAQSLVQHFGLGPETHATVEIAWPSGTRATLPDLEANRRHLIVENAPGPSAELSGGSPRPAAPARGRHAADPSGARSTRPRT
jgi:enediyne biosynthesis protein E4